jgi:hypothetical protein
MAREIERAALFVFVSSVVGCAEPADYGPCLSGAVVNGPSLTADLEIFAAPAITLESEGGRAELVVTFDGDGTSRTARFPLLGARVPSLLAGIPVATRWRVEDEEREIKLFGDDGSMVFFASPRLTATTNASLENLTSVITPQDTLAAQDTCREADDVGYFMPVVISADGGDVTLEPGTTVDFELNGHAMHAELPWSVHTNEGARDVTMMMWDRGFEPAE